MEAEFTVQASLLRAVALELAAELVDETDPALPDRVRFELDNRIPGRRAELNVLQFSKLSDAAELAAIAALIVQIADFTLSHIDVEEPPPRQ